MNVLILTPDAVGSTLLQRLTTIYMQFHDFDRPVINLHELTNGITKYFSPEFNQEIVSKAKDVESWGYYQSLEEIVKLLSSVDHYKTSRLAHYHIRNRGDLMEQQIPFYRYINENFFVIACRRQNIFEHAVSMSLSSITKKNVYFSGEKIDTFLNLYVDPVVMDQEVLLSHLEAYKRYLAWSEDYFNISSFFHYDQCMNDIESYILSLPIFHGIGKKHTWQQKFGISLDDWNRYHHVRSDLGKLAIADINKLKMLDMHPDTGSLDRFSYYQQNAPLEWPAIHNHQDLDNLPVDLRDKFDIMVLQKNKLSVIHRANNSETNEFINQNRDGYERASQALTRMQELGIIVSPPPIKKQTLSEKIRTIKNFNQCVDTYNSWIQKNNEIGSPITQDQFDEQIQAEENFWRDFSKRSEIEYTQLPTQKLEYQNDDDREPDPI